MLNPDLDLARRFLDQHPPPGTLLQCAISGAHLYGFPSPDSDLDLKGIHAAPTRELLGLQPRTEPHDLTEDHEGTEYDLTTNEAAGALRSLLAGNGNMLERILSPYQLADTEHLAPLQALAHSTISRAYARHYAGFFTGCRREHQRMSTVKTLLYSYRVALTGIHLLTTGDLEPNLSILAPRYRFHDVAELIDRKRAGTEHGHIDPALDEHHRTRWPKLEELLAEAEHDSILPTQPPNHLEIDDWLIALRLSQV